MSEMESYTESVWCLQSCGIALTQQQRARFQGPSDLDVMNLHVLAGNMLHWNLLSDLHTQKSVSTDLAETSVPSAQTAFRDLCKT